MNLKYRLVITTMMLNLYAFTYGSSSLQRFRPALTSATTNLINTAFFSTASTETQSLTSNYTRQQMPTPLTNSTNSGFKPLINHQTRSFSTSPKMLNIDLNATPDHNEISQFLENNFINLFDQNVSFSKIAWPLQYKSYEEIIETIYKIDEMSKNNGLQKISMNSFYSGLNNILHGPKKFNKILLPNNNGTMILSPNPEKNVAYHEAGHAIAELYNSTGHIVTMMTAENYRALDGFITRINGYLHKPIRKDLLSTMIMRLAGSVTEQVFGIDQSAQMLTDPNEIFNFLIHKTAGGDFEKFIKSLQQLIGEDNLTQKQAEALCVQFYQATYKFVEDHKKEIKAMAERLMEKGTIFEDEIYDLAKKPKPLYSFEPGPLPKEHSHQYYYRGQPNRYGYDDQGNYVGESGYRDKDGKLEEIN